MAGRIENLHGAGFGDRPPEERKGIAAEAGRRSGEARRRKRDLRRCAQECLQARPPEEIAERLSAMGIRDDDITIAMAVILAQIDKALAGDVRAAEFLRDTVGENPRDEIRREELKLKKQALKAQQGTDAPIIQIIDNLREDD